VNTEHTLPSQRGSATVSRSLWMLWPWGLVIGAWGILLIGSSQSHLSILDHDYLLRESHLPWLLALGIFLVSWQLMTAAMMFPSTLLTLSTLLSFDHERKSIWGKQVGFIIAYASVWLVFALLAFLGDTLIHFVVSRWFWLYMHSWLIGTTTLGVAGVFQLSSSKGRCLKMCANFSSTYPSIVQEKGNAAWHLGLRYGLYCVGSCWALMLVMFGNGGKSIIWTAALSAIVVAEKTMPHYRFIRHGIGIAFLLLTLGMVLINYPSF